ncbi:hypothetical protein [Phytomonospora endophytica]|uniref:Uncharacterized membrane protein HdeD (DUF308 family) n=1 Tax=Phytomonospora endophytica TaxID=714109 RepID=A0A841FWK6_9ACTN|nr:hypothetical protein [Phytomonospora endophytica]MBB6036869.1 uncharacterized membrane protein HdeD (DUF308 family) [Phytomonospora endophytica]
MVERWDWFAVACGVVMIGVGGWFFLDTAEPYAAITAAIGMFIAASGVWTAWNRR